MCLKAISRDFFEIVLPKPELSGTDVDFTCRRDSEMDELLVGLAWSSCPLVSDTLLPSKTDLVTSAPLMCGLVGCKVGLPLLSLSLETLPLVTIGEQDFPLGLLTTCEVGGRWTLEVEVEVEVGAPGLLLAAELGLSCIVVLRLGGASREKPGNTRGGDGDGDGRGGFLESIEEILLAGKERVGGTQVPWLRVAGVDCCLVGVDGLDNDFDVGMVGLGVGIVDLDVGVEGLDDGDDAGTVHLDVGVEGLDVVRVLVGVEGLPEAVTVTVERGMDAVEGETPLDLAGVDDLDDVGPVLATIEDLAALAIFIELLIPEDII